MGYTVESSFLKNLRVNTLVGELRHRFRNVLLTLNYLHPAAIGVLAQRGPTAAKKYLSEIYRCSKTDAGLRLPVATLDEVAPGDSQFTIWRPVDWGGSMTNSEITSVCHLAAVSRPRKIPEVGSFRGLTTLNLAINAPEAEVHTLDLPQGFNPDNTVFKHGDRQIIASRGFYYHEGRKEAERIHQHYGDTATFDYKEIGEGVAFCIID